MTQITVRYQCQHWRNILFLTVFLHIILWHNPRCSVQNSFVAHVTMSKQPSPYYDQNLKIAPIIPLIWATSSLNFIEDVKEMKAQSLYLVSSEVVDSCDDICPHIMCRDHRNKRKMHFTTHWPNTLEVWRIPAMKGVRFSDILMSLSLCSILDKYTKCIMRDRLYRYIHEQSNFTQSRIM